jgi:hypothetical protein
MVASYPPLVHDWRQVLRLDHLRALGGQRGLFEHAEFSRPRVDHGYCLDDNGRALVIISRAHLCGVEFPAILGDRCLSFVLHARHWDGWRHRLTAEGRWNRTSSDDAVGRALWGLGAAAGFWPEPTGRRRAARTLLRSLDFDSNWWRPIAYAVLGLSCLQAVEPGETLRAALDSFAARLPRPLWGQEWAWPEERLTYDNARLPEALITAGASLEDQEMLDDGLRLLQWLIEEEAGRRGFSFTPVGGRSRDQEKPGFDQQPLEAWAMADAARRAAEVTGDRGWLVAAVVAASWFLGENDLGIPLYDPVAGSCCDGLTAGGTNRNQGAESTLSALGAILALAKPAGAP